MLITTSKKTKIKNPKRFKNPTDGVDRGDNVSQNRFLMKHSSSQYNKILVLRCFYGVSAPIILLVHNFIDFKFEDLLINALINICTISVESVWFKTGLFSSKIPTIMYVEALHYSKDSLLWCLLFGLIQFVHPSTNLLHRNF